MGANGEDIKHEVDNEVADACIVIGYAKDGELVLNAKPGVSPPMVVLMLSRMHSMCEKMLVFKKKVEPKITLATAVPDVPALTEEDIRRGTRH